MSMIWGTAVAAAAAPAANATTTTNNGSVAAEIRDSLKKTRAWLDIFESVENAARAYNAAARSLRDPKAKTDFPISSSLVPLNPNRFPPFCSNDAGFDQCWAANNGVVGVDASVCFPRGVYQQAREYYEIHKPASSGMSSTLDSYSSTMTVAAATVLAAKEPRRPQPRTPPVAPEDCRSDCNSSSFAIDGGCDR